MIYLFDSRSNDENFILNLSDDMPVDVADKTVNDIMKIANWSLADITDYNRASTRGWFNFKKFCIDDYIAKYQNKIINQGNSLSSGYGLAAFVPSDYQLVPPITTVNATADVFSDNFSMRVSSPLPELTIPQLKPEEALKICHEIREILEKYPNKEENANEQHLLGQEGQTAQSD